VIAAIEDHRQALEELCRKHRVRRLEVFGSAADGTFDPDRSDLDFLVEFMPLEPAELANEYFDLLTALEQLFKRDIDLLTPKAIRNPYFLRDVNRTRRLVYAA